MEGLEITELKLSEALEENHYFRIDSDYFKKALVRILSKESLGSRLKPLKNFVYEGHRVVYENTEVVDPTVAKERDYPAFLQASDIQTPFINSESLCHVDESDWIRYPQGRIKRGEILIEVKGKAEKVAFVPDDFPEKTLVSGSLYKLTPNKRINKYYLLTYFISKYGQAFKERAKTNLLISFVSKHDLYRIPVPDFGKDFQLSIELLVRKAYHEVEQSKTCHLQAESLLLSELGLSNWQPPEPLTYQVKASKVFCEGRLDSEYFNPKFESFAAYMRARLEVELIGQWGKVLKGSSLEYTDDKTGLPVIRSGDLSDIEEEEKFLRAYPNQDATLLKKGDVLISSIGFGSIGKVQVFDKTGEYATVSEVTVVRQNRVNPYYLHYYLRSDAGQMQINRYITGATGQLHLYPKDVEKILVPIVSEELEQNLENLFKESSRLKRDAKRLLTKAKRAVEMAIEESEQAALVFLEGINKAE